MRNTASDDYAIAASFDSDGRNTTTAANGQLVHKATLDQMERLAERLYEVSDGVWCMVGNGLSNQTFVEGPDGLIVIDTGESQEEMQAALDAVRTHTNAPIAAVIYTHFHYCNGTEAFMSASDDIPIWGHELIPDNLSRIASDVGPVSARGLIHQFGMSLPAAGPDGLVGGGLGRFYKNPAHGRGTHGHISPTHLVSKTTTVSLAGLQVVMSPAPSDANDNVNVFFPELDLCVNNIVWPALFNVFAIRGEEYRDPRILLNGIDEIADFDPEHLVCAHGPPLSGRDEIRAGVTDARDAIQFMWDQTVRGINKGLTLGELIARVQLPERFERSYLTQQHYGLVEHHVRQIHAGLRGWFDGNEAELFPLPTIERTQRLIAGFGGRDEVAIQAQAALDDNDLRWALELASWLVRSELSADGRADAGSPDERSLLANVLRAIAQRTRSANIRNWGLTRALELDGQIDLSRHRGFRASRGQVLANAPATFVHGLKTTLVPELAADVDCHIAFVIDGATCGLHVRRGVAVPTIGADADHTVTVSHETWADIISAKLPLADAVASGAVSVTGDVAAVTEALACFEHPSLKRDRER
jgi:alkyl sulfatase BDS1-like metallo-beta-lactamase superfamily hydrolase